MSTQNYITLSGININSGSNSFQACKLSDGNYQVSLTDSNGTVVYDNKIVTKQEYDQIKYEWEKRNSKCAKTKMQDGFPNFLYTGAGTSSFKAKSRTTPNPVNNSIIINGVKVDENTPQEQLDKLGVTNCNICTKDNVTQTMGVNECKNS